MRALEFTTTDGRRKTRLWRERGGAYVVVEVEDQGTGRSMSTSLAPRDQRELADWLADL